jgi:ABC-type polysaccharide/polyol phosphate transport system ATPase subunit
LLAITCGGISVNADTAAVSAAPRLAPSSAPVVIEARGVEKTFRIPKHKVDSFKERATHPFSRAEYRELHALKKISFEVHQGEFFGIVGRNGSGKSSLLKVMASIYRADAGRIRMAGRVAPFIELGVGFNPELTARENVALNGVMMGLSRREAVRRLDAVLEFAELEDFVELKLKNYSSGMMVRLAFAVMVQADADVMLIDEVLAVGDAAFAQKCMDVFREKRAGGTTIVLVTHDMATVQGLCDRAMLLHEGELVYIGHAEETAMRYYRLNFGGEGETGGGDTGGVPDVHARAVDAWLENEAGERIENVEQGRPIGLNIVLEARVDLEGPIFGIHFLNVDGVTVFSFNVLPEFPSGAPRILSAGERVRVRGRIENPLLPGRYFVHCWIFREWNRSGALQLLRLFDFLVYGTRPAAGIVEVKTDVEAVPEREAGR